MDQPDSASSQIFICVHMLFCNSLCVPFALGQILGTNEIYAFTVCILAYLLVLLPCHEIRQNRSREIFFSEISDMKVLITGGGGFIGSHAVVETLLDGHTVVVLDGKGLKFHFYA